jgi:hypothetical protein
MDTSRWAPRQTVPFAPFRALRSHGLPCTRKERRRAALHAERLRLYSSVPCRYKSAAQEAELSSKPEQFAMTRYQFLLLPALAAAILGLGGALNQKPAAGQQPPAPSAKPHTDPRALAVLDKAIDTFSPERVRWLEATVWQQVHCDDFTFQACGRVLTAPGDRSRFDLNVKVGKTQGEMRMVCDGQKLWQSIRVGGEPPVINAWDLPAAREGRKPPPDLAETRSRFLLEQGFAGMAPFLRSLRLCLQNAQCQEQSWKGREVLVISGAWQDESAKLGALPDTFRPRFQTRQCCVYLDAQTSWPHRLEWWGSEKPNQPNTLLMQTEFRNPLINCPLTAERCAEEFTAKPAT